MNLLCKTGAGFCGWYPVLWTFITLVRRKLLPNPTTPSEATQCPSRRKSYSATNSPSIVSGDKPREDCLITQKFT
ncbi:hypothetical protein O181_015019 [Austropuccinia psidii MF-1]|uniref:Uncharacterized protein n=1 Tax=Austropuccinia psidii MF-1 TaxID=1389203 RepID=A0A9Q3BZ77_9BASI|nr:hypothetical protein [Austropuccinia psidii MF-1]